MIEGVEAFARTLAKELEKAGFVVDVRGEAQAGFQTACTTFPDAIVCNLELPDIDGPWVARRIRTESGPVARTPIVFIGQAKIVSDVVQALHVGGDVFLTKPVMPPVVVAQVEAIVAMARRHATSAEDQGPTSLAAFRGDLANFPLASILMMLEMERRTGQLSVVSGAGERGYFVLTGGLFATSEIDGVAASTVDVLRKVLSWRSGRFEFRSRDAGSMPPARGSIGAMVLEAMRLEDETNAGR